MKKRCALATTFFATLLFVSGAMAQEVYKGLAEENPDLTGNPLPATPQETEQETGSKAKVYKGLADENPDLVDQGETDKAPTEKNPEIYEEAKPNPDLTY
ncbi:hypothetical protein Thiowin_01518 [Thiorhodovibrio winogradskyi]|uniref:Uncharacterized protein n=1 Tax=Thiorhodovibrio winogradskyi TaxID=77007 RepID=A0ABZ0S6C8_9GAMM|nr:hypothetical protein [Thiorhodovibrio winogradskyi]